MTEIERLYHKVCKEYPAEKRMDWGNVYFIGDSDVVKIGVSKNVAHRLGTLNCGNVKELELLASVELPSEEASLHLEKILHHKFGDIRLRGEWFTKTEELNHFIGEAKELGDRIHKEGQIKVAESMGNYMRKLDEKVEAVKESMEKMTYCDTCGHQYSDVCGTCETLDGVPVKYGKKKKTNADRIRSMTDEKLTEFLFDYISYGTYEKDLAWLKQETD